MSSSTAVLGGQALLRVEEFGGLALRVMESFERARRIRSCRCRPPGRAALRPSSARRPWRSFRCPLLVAVITTRLGLRRNSIDPPLATGHVDHQLPRGRDAVQQRGQLRAGEVRTGNIELVVDAVVGAVADQHQHQGIGRLGLFGEFVEAGADLLARGRIRVITLASPPAFFRLPVDIVGPHLEALRRSPARRPGPRW